MDSLGFGRFSRGLSKALSALRMGGAGPIRSSIDGWFESGRVFFVFVVEFNDSSRVLVLFREKMECSLVKSVLRH